MQYSLSIPPNPLGQFWVYWLLPYVEVLYLWRFQLMRTTNQMVIMSEYTDGKDVNVSLSGLTVNRRRAERRELSVSWHYVKFANEHSFFILFLWSILGWKSIEIAYRKGIEIANIIKYYHRYRYITGIIIIRSGSSLFDDDTFIVSSILICPIIHSIRSFSQFENLFSWIDPPFLPWQVSSRVVSRKIWSLAIAAAIHIDWITFLRVRDRQSTFGEDTVDKLTVCWSIEGDTYLTNLPYDRVSFHLATTKFHNIPEWSTLRCSQMKWEENKTRNNSSRLKTI